ncbi:Tad domain-containing protein [Neobacillus cucumis]|uniref:TadE/TadG family type IV pilus assembly protein n=1 Tax=Neobacillus cucumis TaxID=1740721 RepID=UPI0018E0236B|nr:TadE/TadG family type IV pilus assembly protein [Neobacillus cucumis]MBI0577632.1 Tad domain-containing protein [Neobacillus cucumis]
MKRILRLLKLRDESGAVLVIVAISMVALLGFAALAIDGGRLYSEKSKLQKAVDAAVLAGAQGLTTNQSRAIENAEDVSQKNGFPLTEANLTVTSDSIKAVRQIDVPLTFAKILGMNNAPVSASAKAIVAPLKKANGIAPIAVEESAVPDSLVLNCGKSNPGTNHGNCGYLDLNGSGADGLANGILNGSTFEVGSKVVETEPGGKEGKVKDAINTLITNDASKPQCKSWETADNSCDRVITIVVIDSWDGANGKSSLNVVKFAAYWIEKYENKTLYGKFIKIVSPGEIGSGTGTGEYSLYGVKLVE